MNIGIDIYKTNIHIAYSGADGGLHSFYRGDEEEEYEIEYGSERQFFNMLFRELTRKFPGERYRLFFGYDKKETEITDLCNVADSEGFEIAGSCDRAVLPAIVYRSQVHDYGKVNVIFVEETDTKLYCLQKKKSGYSISYFAYSCEYEETYKTRDLLPEEDNVGFTDNIIRESDKQAKIKRIESYIGNNAGCKTIVVGSKATEFIECLNNCTMLIRTEKDKSSLIAAYGAAICNNNLQVPTLMRLATRVDAEVAVAGKKYSAVLFEKNQELEEGALYKKKCEVEVGNHSSVDIAILDDGIRMDSFTIRLDGNNLKNVHLLEFVSTIRNGKVRIQIYDEMLNEKKGLFGGLRKTKELMKETEISF